MKRKRGKRALALFMTVMMLMTSWVFLPASAIKYDSTKTHVNHMYDVRITYSMNSDSKNYGTRYVGTGNNIHNYYNNSNNKVDGDYCYWNTDKNNMAGFSIFYNEDYANSPTSISTTNGSYTYDKRPDGEIAWSVGSTGGNNRTDRWDANGNMNNSTDIATSTIGTIDSKGGGTGTAQCTIPGFPTSIFVMNDKNNVTDNVHLDIDKIEVRANNGKHGSETNANVGTWVTVFQGRLRCESDNDNSSIWYDFNGRYIATDDNDRNKFVAPATIGLGSLNTDNSSDDGCVTSFSTLNWTLPKADSIVIDQKVTTDPTAVPIDTSIAVPTDSSNVTATFRTHLLDQYGAIVESDAIGYTRNASTLGGNVSSESGSASTGISVTNNATTATYDPGTITVSSAARITSDKNLPENQKITSSNKTVTVSYTFGGKTVTKTLNFSITDPLHVVSFKHPTNKFQYAQKGSEVARFCGHFGEVVIAPNMNVSGNPMIAASDQTGHYVFDGWVLNDGGQDYDSGKVTPVESIGTSDITYYAHFGHQNHTMTEHIDKQPACEDTGLKHNYCTTPNCTYQTAQTTIAMLGHHWVAGQVHPATCDEQGYTEYSCDRPGCTKTKHDDFVAPINHENAVWRTLNPATCEQGGTEELWCPDCHTQRDTRPVAPLGHNVLFDDAHRDPDNDVQPGCGSAGKWAYKCDRDGCNHFELVDSPEPAQDHLGPIGDWEEYSPATCTEDAVWVKRCQRCGNPVEWDYHHEPSLGHNFDDGVWVSGKAPTCTTDGTKHFTCQRPGCGYSEDRVIAGSNLGHDYQSFWTIPQKGTCTTNGYKYHKCSRCPEYTDYTVITAREHVWDTNPFETHSSGCAEGSNGFEKFHCTNVETEDYAPCTEVDTRPLVLAEHSWNSGVVTTPATCLAAGEKTFTCVKCGAIKTEPIPKADHTFAPGFTVDSKATCTQDGSKSRHCTTVGCVATTDVTPIPHRGHAIGGVAVDPSQTDDDYWNNFTPSIFTPETCTTNGLKVWKCDNQGSSEYLPCTEELHRKVLTAHHIFSTDFTVDTQPTCTTAGSKSHHCTRAGCTVKADQTSIPALGHDYDMTNAISSQPSSCMVAGWEIYQCTRHGQAGCTSDQAHGGVTITVPRPLDKVNGHVWQTGDNWTIDKPATCTETGLKSHHCTVAGCGEKKDEVTIGKAAHTYDLEHPDRQVASTCTTPGYKEFDCTVCHNETNRVSLPLDPSNHEWDTTYTIDIDPTCETDGSKSIHCKYHQDAVKPGSTNTTDTDVLRTGHNWGDIVSKNNATCHSNATGIQTCRNDPSHTREVTIPNSMVGHNFINYQETVPATCTTNAKETGKCQWCVAENTREIPNSATGHNTESQAWSTQTAATCTTKEVQERHCTNQGCRGGIDKNGVPSSQTRTVGEFAPHTFGDWIIQTPRTCVKYGYKYRKCEKCGFMEQDTEYNTHLDAHQEESEPYKIEGGSCTTQGTAYYRCAVCHVDLRTEPTTAGNHKYGEWEVIKAPTCEKPGVKQHTCTACGFTETAVIPANGHTWVDTDKVPAKCGPNVPENQGYVEQKCSVCGETRRQILEPEYLEHDFDYSNLTWDEVVIGKNVGICKEATCTECAMAGLICKRCKRAVDADETHWFEFGEPAGHNFGDWVLQTTGDCETQDSIWVSTCADCGLKKVKTEAPSGHVFGEWVTKTPATCTQKATLERTCTACGKVETKQGTEFGPHKIAFTNLAPTCKDDGYQNQGVCTECSKVIIPGTTVAATGKHVDANGDGKCDTCQTAMQSTSPSAECNCNCHKSGIRHFFFLIQRLFWKMFKTHKTCSCGELHY